MGGSISSFVSTTASISTGPGCESQSGYRASRLHCKERRHPPADGIRSAAALAAGDDRLSIGLAVAGYGMRPQIAGLIMLIMLIMLTMEAANEQGHRSAGARLRRLCRAAG